MIVNIFARIIFIKVAILCKYMVFLLIIDEFQVIIIYIKLKMTCFCPVPKQVKGDFYE